MWLTGSLVCTTLNKNVWPLPSLNVFSELSKEKLGQWVIRVTNNNESHDLDPGNVLPLEFFAARSFVGNVAYSGDEVRLSNLLDYINVHLADSRSGFDERWEKVKINPRGDTRIQILLKVSKLEKKEKFEMNFLDEYLVGEKSYVR